MHTAELLELRIRPEHERASFVWHLANSTILPQIQNKCEVFAERSAPVYSACESYVRNRIWSSISEVNKWITGESSFTYWRYKYANYYIAAAKKRSEDRARLYYLRLGSGRTIKYNWKVLEAYAKDFPKPRLDTNNPYLSEGEILLQLSRADGESFRVFLQKLGINPQEVKPPLKPQLADIDGKETIYDMPVININNASIQGKYPFDDKSGKSIGITQENLGDKEAELQPLREASREFLSVTDAMQRNYTAKFNQVAGDFIRKYLVDKLTNYSSNNPYDIISEIKSLFKDYSNIITDLPPDILEQWTREAVQELRNRVRNGQYGNYTPEQFEKELKESFTEFFQGSQIAMRSALIGLLTGTKPPAKYAEVFPSKAKKRKQLNLDRQIVMAGIKLGREIRKFCMKYASKGSSVEDQARRYDRCRIINVYNTLGQVLTSTFEGRYLIGMVTGTEDIAEDILFVKENGKVVDFSPAVKDIIRTVFVDQNKYRPYLERMKSGVESRYVVSTIRRKYASTFGSATTVKLIATSTPS